MSSFKINSIDDSGCANVTVEIDGKEYTQELIGLPVDSAPALKERLCEYVNDYEQGLTSIQDSDNSSDGLPNTITSLIGKSIAIETTEG